MPPYYPVVVLEVPSARTPVWPLSLFPQRTNRDFSTFSDRLRDFHVLLGG